MSHVIAAVSTGNQISAIGILRLTGDGCAYVAGKVFKCKNGQPLSKAPNRKLVMGTLQDRQGRTIDSCLAVYTRGPHSYTGEDTVEIQCHGSPAVEIVVGTQEFKYLSLCHHTGFPLQLFIFRQMDLRQIAAVCVPVQQGMVSCQQMLRFF